MATAVARKLDSIRESGGIRGSRDRAASGDDPTDRLALAEREVNAPAE